MKVMLIVDMVKGFTDEKTNNGICGMRVPGAKELIPAINEEIAKLDKDDWIIHVNDTHPEDDPEFGMFPIHCVKGTEQCETASGFDYGGREMRVIPKTRFSGFYDTPLDFILQFMELDELIVVGVATEICILHTVADARFGYFNVTIPRVCVQGISPDNESRALEHMRDVLGAKVV